VAVWLIAGQQARTHRNLTEQRRPGRNMFAQGAMTKIARRRWGPTDETSRKRLGQATRRSDQA
jgi:hypothetical protein